MSEFLEKSRIISSAIFLAFPYGLIGNCASFQKWGSSKSKTIQHVEHKQVLRQKGEKMIFRRKKSKTTIIHLWRVFSNWHLFRFTICCTCAGVYQGLHAMSCHSLQYYQSIWCDVMVIPGKINQHQATILFFLQRTFKDSKKKNCFLILKIL